MCHLEFGTKAFRIFFRLESFEALKLFLEASVLKALTYILGAFLIPNYHYFRKKKNYYITSGWSFEVLN